jgi:glycosyltransferase involved in cell wall biosynthesis
MRIGIATPVLLEGDAVGNDVLGMYHSLERARHTPILYAKAAHVPFPVRPIDRIANLDLYIYHHSVFCESGVKFFRELDCRKIVKYHNITPPHWFAPGSEAALHCEMGLDQLEEILSIPCDVWVDSEYNGRCLQEVRECQFKVVPPYNQVDLLQRSTANETAVVPFDDGATNILMVGRIAPNKDVLGAIEAFQLYTRRNRNARLIVAGDDGGSYGEEVKRRIVEDGLTNVAVTGKVDVATLKALYLIADVLLITSQHEGFCVPMVEAMAMRVPVIANRQCALPFTGGDAVYYAERPDDIAAGISHVLDNREEFVERGSRRFEDKFQNSLIESSILAAIKSMQVSNRAVMRRLVRGLVRSVMGTN